MLEQSLSRGSKPWGLNLKMTFHAGWPCATLITIIFFDTLSILISSLQCPVRACIPLLFLRRPPRFPSFHRCFFVSLSISSRCSSFQATYSDARSFFSLTSHSNTLRFSRTMAKPSSTNVPFFFFFLVFSFPSFLFSFNTRCKTQNEIMIVDRSAILRFLLIIYRTGSATCN